MVNYLILPSAFTKIAFEFYPIVFLLCSELEDLLELLPLSTRRQELLHRLLGLRQLLLGQEGLHRPQVLGHGILQLRNAVLGKLILPRKGQQGF